jgi:hypothetical protein
VPLGVNDHVRLTRGHRQLRPSVLAGENAQPPLRGDVVTVRGGARVVQARRLRTAPPGVEYQLTELGETLLDPVRSLSRWAEEHTEELLDAQAAA